MQKKNRSDSIIAVMCLTCNVCDSYKRKACHPRRSSAGRDAIDEMRSSIARFRERERETGRHAIDVVIDISMHVDKKMRSRRSHVHMRSTNYRSLLQKSPIKKPVFCKRDI